MPVSALNYKRLTKLIWQLLNFLLLPAPSRATSLPNDTTYYMVTVEDADLAQHDANNMAFLVSLILRAAQDDSFPATREAKQFIVDLPRSQHVLENGREIEHIDAGAILERWSRELAQHTKLPQAKIQAVLATLNQGAGYGAVAGILHEGGTRNGVPMIFSAAQRSSYCSSYVERKGNTFILYRTVPLHAHKWTQDLIIERERDPNNPDIIVTTKVTINMDHFSARKRPGARTLLDLAPGAVMQTSAVQMRDPKIKLNSKTLPQYTECETQGFVLLPDADLLNDQDWVHTSAPRI
jgi:hypothetical protein